MTTRLSNPLRGVLKTPGMLPGAMRGLLFDQRVEQVPADRDDLAPIVRPMLAASWQLGERIAAFDKAVRASVLAYVSTLEEPARFARSRPVAIGRRAHGADAPVSIGRARSSAAAGSRDVAARWPACCCMRRPSCF